MTASRPSTRRLIVLGSTGNIGANTLHVVRHLNRHQSGSIEVVGLAAGSRAELLIEQARRFDVRNVAIADETKAHLIRKALPQVHVRSGPDAASLLVESTNATHVCAAVVGSAGLAATIAAARKGTNIGLANKETLVAAGALITPMVQQHHACLIPIDSEHSAIFQCLNGQARRAGIKRIILTASGGPFRTSDKQSMDSATVEQALRHPTWKMGPKITIDSATMMNKALEVIEAHWLFGLPAEKIDVIIHPQSMAHSFVEFDDNSVLGQFGPPDMRTPIQYALTYPDRLAGCGRALDWSTLRSLDFEQPDFDRFQSLALAYDVIKAGGTAGAVFNAANEAAVAAFLARSIRFGRIVELVSECLANFKTRPADCLQTVLETDQQARDFVNRRVKQANKQIVLT